MSGERVEVLADTQSFGGDFGFGVEIGFVGLGGGEQLHGPTEKGFQVVLGLKGVGDMGGEIQNRPLEIAGGKGGNQTR